MTPRLESAEQAAIIKLLDSLGFIIWPTSEGRMVRRPAGLPDLYAYHPEHQRALWVEVKAEGGRVSPEQRLFQAMHGGIPVVIGGHGDVIRWLLAHPDFHRDGMLLACRTETYREWHRVRREELAKRKAWKSRVSRSPRQKRKG